MSSLNDKLERPRADLTVDHLGKWINYEVDVMEPGLVKAHMTMEPYHIAPNGYFYAGLAISFADIMCARGTIALLPHDLMFVTMDITSNLLGTARSGVISGVARARHIGKTTQIWDAEVTSEESGKLIALFRCSQLIIKNK